MHNHPLKTEYIISGGTERVFPENAQPVDYVEQTGDEFWPNMNSKYYVENIEQTIVKITFH